MKTRLLFIVSLFTFSLAVGENIDKNTAIIVAKNFYLKNAITTSINKQGINLSLVHTCVMQNTNAQAKIEEHNLFYVFNVNASDGFVVVAADDIVTPILGYSTHGTYDKGNLAPAFEKWMEGYKSQIREAINSNIQASETTREKWNELINTQGNYPQVASTTVGPLLNTSWGQGTDNGGYNSYCPYNSICSRYTVTGCVATAMAQIMKYYNYPAHGTGFHSYKYNVPQN